MLGTSKWSPIVGPLYSTVRYNANNNNNNNNNSDSNNEIRIHGK